MIRYDFSSKMVVLAYAMVVCRDEHYTEISGTKEVVYAVILILQIAANTANLFTKSKQN